MWYYFFDRHYGIDRVAFAQKLHQIKVWDFFEARWIWYVVCLWKDISWVEQYTKYVDKQLEKAEIIPLWNLFSKQTIHLLHWFTQHRFCSYKKAIPLRVWDIQELAKRKKSKKKKNEWIQQLMIYPNLRSIHNDFSIEKLQTWYLLLHWQSTKKTKAEGYWHIQSWVNCSVVCTFSQMFQDWQNLTSISFMHQHMRYYKNQQDPRYHSLVVVKKMSELYNVSLDVSWYSLE